MKKCIHDRINIEEIEHSPAVLAAEEDINVMAKALKETMTEQQRALFREYDDAMIALGTLRVNTALSAACGCEECLT